MVNPAIWSEELLVGLHREVLLLPDVKGMLAVASGWIDALIIAGLPMGYGDIAGLPMGYEDIAPIPLIITEADGRVSDLDGKDVLAGNGHLHDALLDLVRDVPSSRDYQSLSRPAGNRSSAAPVPRHGPAWNNSQPFIGPCASSGWSYSSCQFHQLYGADCG